jgi:hypothetical protein
LIKDIQLENKLYALGITIVVEDDTTIPVEPIDIDTLARDYPD